MQLSLIRQRAQSRNFARENHLLEHALPLHLLHPDPEKPIRRMETPEPQSLNLEQTGFSAR